MTNPTPLAGVTRYKISHSGDHMLFADAGEWVRHSDHAAALAAKEGEIERQNGQVQYLKDQVAESAHIAKDAAWDIDQVKEDRDRLAAENARLREEVRIAYESRNAAQERANAANRRLEDLIASEKVAREALNKYLSEARCWVCDHLMPGAWRVNLTRTPGEVPDQLLSLRDRLNLKWFADYDDWKTAVMLIDQAAKLLIARQPEAAPQPETKGGGET